MKTMNKYEEAHIAFLTRNVKGRKTREDAGARCTGKHDKEVLKR
jgi:hypothetical protein